MPRNGAGVFNRNYSWVTDASNGLNIDATRMDTDTNDIATALTQSIASDGQTLPSANLPMNGFKHTGAAAASASGQYLVYGQSAASLTGASFANTTLTGTTSITGGATISGAALEMSAQPINWADRVDVASAANTNIDTAASNYIRITGTTTITNFTLGNGNLRALVFQGSLTLSAGAAILLPGSTSIVTQAGDIAIVIGEASNVVRLLSYQVAQPVTSSLSHTTVSSTAVDVTGINAAARRVTVNFEGVSSSGTSNMIVQLGTSGGVQVTGYSGACASIAGGTTSSVSMTDGFLLSGNSAAASTLNGSLILTLSDSTNGVWCGQSTIGFGNNTNVSVGAGSKSLAGTLTRLRLTTSGGTDTFDAGAISVLVEYA